ncbi:hypothetical protein EMPS_00125 [Entomortierella parvispora]|uniref:Uncharacterized protein n=1 Tax=Entomortierella parvispora TaxID=205924 RepID=A0A9P3LR37_9FUNG|nr:hypothetical protein EMPS_00125 [Entomortierella parvispora]
MAVLARTATLVQKPSMAVSARGLQDVVDRPGDDNGSVVCVKEVDPDDLEEEADDVHVDDDEFFFSQLRIDWRTNVHYPNTESQVQKL